MRRALSANPPDRFLRVQANLVILVIAGSDDASRADGAPVPVATYVDFLRALKPEYRLLLSVIGPSDECSIGAGAPNAAPRLAALTNAPGRVRHYVPSCSDQLATALAPFAERIADAFPTTCIAARDVDPERAGLQADCSVDETIVQIDGTIQRTTLPSCDLSAPPCWRLDASGFCQRGKAMVSARGADWCAELAPADEISCLGCADPADPACSDS